MVKRMTHHSPPRHIYSIVAFFANCLILSYAFTCLDCVGDECPPVRLNIGDSCGGPCGKNGLCGGGLRCSTEEGSFFALLGVPQVGVCVSDETNDEAAHHRLKLFAEEEKRAVAIPGGATAISVQDPDLLAALDYGMRVYNQMLGLPFYQPLLITSVFSATEQVASGLRYTAILSATQSNCTEEGAVPETSTRESYFSCYEGNQGCLNNEGAVQWYEMDVWAHAPINEQRDYDLMSVEQVAVPNELDAALLECLGCCPGCKFEMNVTAERTVELAHIALQLLANATGLPVCQYELKAVHNATYQVVSGIKYDFNVAVAKYNACDRVGAAEDADFEIEFLFQSWKIPRYFLLNYKELEKKLYLHLAIDGKDSGKPKFEVSIMKNNGTPANEDAASNSVSPGVLTAVAGLSGLLILLLFGLAIYGGTPTNGHPIDEDGNVIETELELGGEHLISYQQHQS